VEKCGGKGRATHDHMEGTHCLLNT